VTLVERLRKDSEDVWRSIVDHPFVVGLYTGNLPLDKFKFYILQDYHYLVTAIRNFGIIASRADSVDALRDVVRILHLEATSEFDGYGDLLKRLGYTLKDAAETKPMPVSVSYGSFLIATSSTGSFAEAMTSVLPCFWSYAEIASDHKGRLEDNPSGLYKDWAVVYLSESYLSLVEKMKEMVNRAGEGFPYERLRDVFATASRYEYMFWDAAYKMEGWPP
jgi:thiaminase/transcriptional activator TenA